MRILILKNAEWNDVTFANNLLTSWFEGVDATFANIYCGPGLPLNSTCEKYFRITDKQLLRSFWGSKKAGNEIHLPKGNNEVSIAKKNASREGIYGIFKRISIFAHTPVMLLKDFLWLNGKYNIAELNNFILDFKPDIIFTYRVFNPQTVKLERIVHNIAAVPMVAFTGDDEITYDCYSFSPLFWIRRLYTRYLFKKHACHYSYYLTLSKKLADYYSENFNIPSSVCYKGGYFSQLHANKEVGRPIKMIYAGRLCYGRWKTLVKIGQVLETLNGDVERIILNVYTQDILTDEINSAFRKLKYVFLSGSLSSEELIEKYKVSDIALHVESFEKKYMLATMYSFSTKIVDLMNSTCAILAICNNNQAGYMYLKENDAAICISSYDDISETLSNIIENESIITEYAEKAWMLGKKNHNREKIQQDILVLFQSLINI